MSRMLFVVVLLWIAACSDQTSQSVTAPDQAVGSSGSGSENSDGKNRNSDSRDLDAAHTALSGGAVTVFDASPTAFGHPAPQLQGERLARHEFGDAQFALEFVSTPGSANSGLGPVFDNVACESCHQADGRGHPPVGGEPFSSMLFRGSVSGAGPHGGPAPIPGFGGQLQLRAIPGLTPEIQAAISYAESAGTFADGTTFHLRVPEYTLTSAYSTLPGGALYSPRVAPAVFGLGLLEAVPEDQIQAMAHRHNGHEDGVSGHPNYVWDQVNGRVALGRFGWKANVPTLVQQVAGAYNGDIGITSSLFPVEACEGEYPECAAHPPEINDQVVEAVSFYNRTLGVPARRNLDDAKTQRGERLFYASGCNGCHTPTLRTGELAGVPEVSNQIIHPYTDLLVHNMGPALADERPDFRASGSEWRTAPLWGIGLVHTVSGHNNFLHDGRARGVLEAVLWHGGEAKAAREGVQRLPAADREALVAFLESL